MNSPLISIIVPVYNTEKYLDQCIQSVLAQTYTNWELLLIDDGSTDASGAICDKYAAEENRIRVSHKKNEGAQSARDYGTKKAKGEWIAFVDSDDYIDKLYLGTFVKYICPTYDILVSGVSFQGEISNNNYIKQLLNRKMRSELWGKIFRRTCAENTPVIPNRIRIGEDLIANLLYALHSSKSIRCFTDQLYFYTQNPTSITHTRTPSVEHDELFLSTITGILQPQLPNFYNDLNLLRLWVLEDLIVCKAAISYNRPWIKELRNWSKRHHDNFTCRQKIVLCFSNNLICRYLLALERRIVKFIAICHQPQ